MLERIATYLFWNWGHTLGVRALLSEAKLVTAPVLWPLVQRERPLGKRVPLERWEWKKVTTNSSANSRGLPRTSVMYE